jgi:hypothetical protein
MATVSLSRKQMKGLARWNPFARIQGLSCRRCLEFDDRSEPESDVDREIHIERMKRELEELSGGSISGRVGKVSPEPEEIFLERVCEFEKAAWDTNFDRLIKLGFKMVPPAELDDVHLGAKLDEVVRNL